MTKPHWSLTAAVFVVQTVSVGAIFGAFTVFVPPVRAEFGGTQGEVSAGIGLIGLMLGMTGPFWGRWIDTGAFRRIMLTGSAVTASCFFAAAGAPDLMTLGATCLVMGAFIPLVGPLTSSALIGKVFVESRGRAMGIAGLGPPVGSALFAVLAGELISRFDWRLTLQVFGAISLLLIPLIAIVIPREVRTAPTAQEAADGDWTRARLMRTPDFWGAGLAMGLTAGISTGWGAQVVSFVIDLGYDLAPASRIAALSGGMGILGTLGFGMLADRWDPKWLMVGTILAMLTAFAVYLTEPAYAGLVGAAVLYGICGGSILPLYALILTGRFGAAGLGRALGMTNLFVMPVAALSPFVAGALRDSSGSFALPITVLGAGLLIGAGSLLMVRRPHGS